MSVSVGNHAPRTFFRDISFRPQANNLRTAAGATLALCILLAAVGVCAPDASAQAAWVGGPLGPFPGASGVAVDKNGNVYVADTTNYGEVQELSEPCTSNCLTTLYTIAEPVGVAVDSNGNVYEAGNSYGIYEIPAGCTAGEQLNNLCTVTQLGGQPGDQIEASYGIAVDSNGNVYVAYTSKNEVIEMPPGCTASNCVTVLGGGFNQPYGVAVDSSGNVYVADYGNNAVKEMPSGCTAVRYAGNACTVTTLGSGFDKPSKVTLDSNGNIYVADTGNAAIKEMTPGCASSSCVTTLAGGFSVPSGVAVDSNGNVYVSDSGSNVNAVFEIVRTGLNAGSVAVNSPTAGSLTVTLTFSTQTTIGAPAVLTQGASGLDFTNAGTGSCTSNSIWYPAQSCTVNVNFKPKSAGPRYGAVVLSNTSGVPIASANIYGTGVVPQIAFSPSAITTLGSDFNNPFGVAVDASDNVYVADYTHGEVKEMSAGCLSSSCVMALGGGFSNPRNVAVDGVGNVYVTNFADNFVRQIPAGCKSSDCVTALPGAFNLTGSPDPWGIAVDGSGNVFVADQRGIVYEIHEGCSILSTCVTALPGAFNRPQGVAVDGTGNVYVADTYNNAVKEIPAGCATSTCVNTLGGGFSGPSGVAVDGSGNVYVVDTENALKEISPGCASSACVTKLAGGPTVIQFADPLGVAIDGSGNVYIADTDNSEVKELGRATPPSLIFAATDFGKESSPQSITVQNIGTAALFFPVPSTGTNPSVSSNFLWDSSSTCRQTNSSSSTAFSLPSGASCTMAIDFAPTATGSISGSLVLTDNALMLLTAAPFNPHAPNAATQTVPLSGTGFAAPSLTSPAVGSTIAGSTTFTWNPGIGASNFALWIGTSPGSKDLYTSGVRANTVTSRAATIPANGATLYVSLYYEIDGVWYSRPYTFTEATAPSLTSPTASILGGATTFTWSVGTGASNFALWIGTSAGSKNLYTSGVLAKTVTSRVATIPANGGTLYVSLYYEVGGAWSSRAYTFTEATAPSLTGPTASTLGGGTTFTWNPGTGSSNFALWVGTSAGSKNLYTSGVLANTVTSRTVNIPANGATLYVSLYFEVNGAWSFTAYTFTEATAPSLTSPSSSPLSGSTKFTWNPGIGSSHFALWLGTTPGSKNLYTSGVISNTVTSRTVTIPANGAALYVTLNFEVNGAWSSTAYTFTEAP